MSQTKFASPHGLDDRGHSSAADLMRLLRVAPKDPTFRGLIGRRFAVVRSDPSLAEDPEPQRDALAVPGCIGRQDRKYGGIGLCLWRRPTAEQVSSPSSSWAVVTRSSPMPPRSSTTGSRHIGADTRRGWGGARERPGAWRHVPVVAGRGSEPWSRWSGSERSSGTSARRPARIPAAQRFRRSGLALASVGATLGKVSVLVATCRLHGAGRAPGGVGRRVPSPGPSEVVRACSGKAERPNRIDRPGSRTGQARC